MKEWCTIQIPSSHAAAQRTVGQKVKKDLCSQCVLNLCLHDQGYQQSLDWMLTPQLQPPYF